jgi:hypothetical protein
MLSTCCVIQRPGWQCARSWCLPACNAVLLPTLLLLLVLLLQERLRTLLPPEYMQPIDEGLPSYLQWGFACVRSRALQLGPQAFGLVPFIDIANHAADPNADIRVPPPGPSAAAAAQAAQAAADGAGADGAGAEAAAAAAGAGDQGFVELVAVQDIAAGQEVTISYTGLSGYTNQRFMAQYGFVPRQGNVADRLELQVPDR